MALSKIAAFILTGGTVIGTVGGGALYVEDRYMNEEDGSKVFLQVVAVEKDLEVHVLTEQIDAKQERIWKYEDRLDRKPNDAEAKQRLRELNAEVEHLEEKLKEAKKN